MSQPPQDPPAAEAPGDIVFGSVRVRPPQPPPDLSAAFCGDCDPAEETDVPPVERIVLPADVAEFAETDDMVYIIGTREGKVTKIGGLEKMENLKTLVLRCCLVSHIEGLETLAKLEKLELYDNHIEYITGIHCVPHLRVLDLSFNSIRQLIDLGQYVPLLEELYVAQNKLRQIEGLEGLAHLRVLDLGANRIRVVEGLSKNTQMRSLWLGKNKIEKVEGLEALTQLEQLDMQNNRLTSLGDGLAQQTNLRELYLACNQIPDVSGLPPSPSLHTVDLSSNGVQSVAGIDALASLQEVWLTGSALASFEALAPFSRMPNLHCLYLEHSPIAKDFEYRMALTRMVPTLEQLDATLVRRA